MPKLIVTKRDGDTISLDAEIGHSVMETIRDNGIDEMLAICGGCLACATCHVYVDSAFVSALPPMVEDERDLLGSSAHLLPNSRLSCQVSVTAELDGLHVTLAPED